MPRRTEAVLAKARRRYSAKVKCPVVREALKGAKSPAQIAKAYRVHPHAVGIGKR
jgi:transposase-like protein